MTEETFSVWAEHLILWYWSQWDRRKGLRWRWGGGQVLSGSVSNKSLYSKGDALDALHWRRAAIFPEKAFFLFFFSVGSARHSEEARPSSRDLCVSLLITPLVLFCAGGEKRERAGRRRPHRETTVAASSCSDKSRVDSKGFVLWNTKSWPILWSCHIFLLYLTQDK